MPKSDAEVAFDQQLIQHNELVGEQPVDNTALFASLEVVDRAVNPLFNLPPKQTNKYASAMLKVYSQVSSLEVVPPLTLLQSANVLGKVATYQMLMESTAPKKRSKQAAPTDTNKIETDKPKV